MIKPRIRLVLLLVNLVLLALPLGGLWLLRIYESALVRQTETELLAQGAVIGAAYRAAWTGGAMAPGAGLAPRFAVLDLARDPVLPPPRPGVPAAADLRAMRAGAALVPILAEAQRATLAAMRVTDAAGVVVASSGSEQGLSLAAMEEVALALRGEGTARVRSRVEAEHAGPASISRGATFRVFVSLPVRDGGAVVGAVLLSRTPASIGQAIWGKRWELAGLAALLVGLAAAFAGFTAYTVSRPLGAVVAQAKAVAAGGRGPITRPRRSAVRETDELFHAIASMAATLERRADYIGQFATEVSHEFKTPLAALRGALELLAEHEMSEAERAGFLAQASEDVARLERLVRRLLELARAEAPRASAGEAWLEGGAGPPLHVAMPPETWRAVLAILRDNVAQHAGPGAVCRVTWKADGGWAIILVADDGRGISPANAARVFDRFFTTAREAGGTGLGLSIARGHVEAAGGTMRLLSAEKGTMFEIRLPLAAGAAAVAR